MFTVGQWTIYLLGHDVYSDVAKVPFQRHQYIKKEKQCIQIYYIHVLITCIYMLHYYSKYVIHFLSTTPLADLFWMFCLHITQLLQLTWLIYKVRRWNLNLSILFMHRTLYIILIMFHVSFMFNVIIKK